MFYIQSTSPITSTFQLIVPLHALDDNTCSLSIIVAFPLLAADLPKQLKIQLRHFQANHSTLLSIHTIPIPDGLLEDGDLIFMMATQNEHPNPVSPTIPCNSY